MAQALFRFWQVTTIPQKSHTWSNRQQRAAEHHREILRVSAGNSHFRKHTRFHWRAAKRLSSIEWDLLILPRVERRPAIPTGLRLVNRSMNSEEYTKFRWRAAKQQDQIENRNRN